VSSDFWRHWQAFSPFAGNPGAPTRPSSAAPGFGPYVDSAERFAAAAQAFIANAGRASAASDAPTQAAFAAMETFGNFLREQFAAFFDPAWPPNPAGPGPIGSAFTEAPAFGLGREQLLRAQRAAEAWNGLLEAQGRLQRMWSDTLRAAAIDFSSRPVPVEPLTRQAIDRLYDEWIECAEQAYGRMAHSDDFTDALGAFVNAGSQWRRESAGGIEEWAKLLDLPTRSEISALTLRLRELEAQLRAMQEQPERGPRRSPAPAADPPRRAPRSGKPTRTASPSAPRKPARAPKSRAARTKRPR
jgi:hypothetical protein